MKLYEGNNELNVQLTPLTGTLVYDQPVGYLTLCLAATAFKVVDFSCTISNPTNQVMTKQLRMMYRNRKNSPAGPWSAWFDSGWRGEITLQPLQVTYFKWNGNYFNPIDGQWYCWFLAGFVNQDVACHLQDNDGGVSPDLVLSS